MIEDMKVVMFADLHLERQFAWADGPAAVARRSAIRRSLTRTVELAVAEQADAIFCAGDLYENEFFSPDTANFVAEALDCGIPAFLAPGNHDYYSPRSMYATTRWPGSVHVFTESQFRPVELAPGCTIWGAGHTAPTGTEGFFDRFSGAQRSGLNLGVFHGSESHGFHSQGTEKVAHAPFRADQVAAAGFDYAFVGHYHQAVADRLHCYPGNPDPLEFGELGDRGAVVATVADSGAVDVQVRNVATTLCSSIELDVSSCRSSTEIETAVADVLADAEGFVRLDLVGELALDVDFDRSRREALAAHGGHLAALLVRDNQLRRAYDLESIRHEDASVRAEFLRQVEHSELPEADKDLVIELGLRAFDDRRDLEVV